MRFVLKATLLLLTLLSLAAGCGAPESSIPTSISSDDQQKLDEAQARVNAEESARQNSMR